MGFFRRFSEGLGHSTRIEGMAEAAAAWGWHAVDGDPVEAGLTHAVHLVARTFQGQMRAPTATNGNTMFGKTWYHDAFRGTVDGRTVSVANSWIDIEAVVAGGQRVVGNSIVAVELTTLLLIAGIEPRGRHTAFIGPELPTGNASFDAAYRVVGVPGLADGTVSPEMQQRIAARDDWAFAAEDTTFVAIGKEPFATAAEVSQRVGDVVAIVAALPAGVAPAQVDHSVDDLLARIARIDDVGDAITFLQQLSDGDRQRLAASPTPLAKFVDVRTPDDAMARLMSLPELERLQVLAMFEKIDGN